MLPFHHLRTRSSQIRIIQVSRVKTPWRRIRRWLEKTTFPPLLSVSLFLSVLLSSSIRENSSLSPPCMPRPDDDLQPQWWQRCNDIFITCRSLNSSRLSTSLLSTCQMSTVLRLFFLFSLSLILSQIQLQKNVFLSFGIKHTYISSCFSIWLLSDLF